MAKDWLETLLEDPEFKIGFTQELKKQMIVRFVDVAEENRRFRTALENIRGCSECPGSIAIATEALNPKEEDPQ